MNQTKFNKPLIAGAVLLFLAVGVIVFTPASLQNIALALPMAGNYSRTTQTQLDMAAWNLLDEDFVRTDGGNAITGNLNMSNNRITNLAAPQAGTDAANRDWVTSQIGSASSIENTSGTSLRAVCGQTPQGATNWVGVDTYTVSVDIDISSYGFTARPQIFTSLNGLNYHYNTTGATSIVYLSDYSFRIYIIRQNYMTITADQARNTYQWYINWCAYGT